MQSSAERGKQRLPRASSASREPEPGPKAHKLRYSSVKQERLAKHLKLAIGTHWLLSQVCKAKRTGSPEHHSLPAGRPSSKQPRDSGDSLLVVWLVPLVPQVSCLWQW